MGVGLLASLSVLQAGMGVAQIVEGQTAQIRAETQAELLAEQKAKKAKKMLGKQTMQFLKSGVGLSGTPSLVLDETVQFAREDMGAIRNYYKDVGRQAKRNATYQGISSIISGGIGLASLKPKKPMTFNSGVSHARSTQGFNPSLSTNTSRFSMANMNNFSRTK